MTLLKIYGGDAAQQCWIMNSIQGRKGGKFIHLISLKKILSICTTKNRMQMVNEFSDNFFFQTFGIKWY